MSGWDQYLKHFLEIRGVRDPCLTCRGLGTTLYGSTATWRGGVGGASMTTDVCDKCWGSGDKNRPGVDLRKLEAKRAAWEAAQCEKWLARQLGVNIGILRPHQEALCKVLEKELRRRKAPEGLGSHGLMFYQDVVEVWIKTIQRMLAATSNEN